MTEDIAPAASPAIPNSSIDSIEQLLFASEDAYIYRIPPAGTAGHRAELWDVNTWLAEVHVKLVRLSNDDACIRLSDAATGELFAECPVVLPLIRSVEPVIDSSRYFVIRVVDSESGNHAFIGLGFREREKASDFNAALCEHASYHDRKAAAEEMRHAAHLQKESSSEDGSIAHDGSGTIPPPPSVDLSLKAPITLHLNAGGSQQGGGFVTSHQAHARGGTLTKTFSLIFDHGNGGTVAALAPPPQSCIRHTAMAVSPSREEGGARGEDAWGEFESAG